MGILICSNRVLVKIKILPVPCKQCLFIAQERELVDSENIGEP